jgi:hypothetical protein
MVRTLDGKEKFPICEFPPLDVTIGKSKEWPYIVTFQAAGQKEFDLDPAVSAKVVMPSQLSAQ